MGTGSGSQRARVSNASWVLIVLTMAGCAGAWDGAAQEVAAAVTEPAPAHATAAHAGDDARASELAAALWALDPGVDPAEARRAARAAFAATRELAASYRMVSPALVHNALVNSGLRERGLCCHWAEDMVTRLHALELHTLEVHWVVAHAGERLREHNSAMLTPRGGGLGNGIIVDGWRDAGQLYWGAASSDRYPWVIHPASAEWRRIHCE